MPHGDDLDQRFNELVSQIDAEQQRKMRTAAKKGARESRRSAGRSGDRLEETHLVRAPRRNGRLWLAVAGITAVIAAGGVVITLRPDLLAPAGPVPEETMPVPEENVPVAAAPLSSASPEAKEGPFAGSKAEDWAEGVDGFVMPAAKAVGGLSKKDVAKGLKRTRKLLEAAYLDHKTIMGGKPTAFMELLHPQERSWFRKGLTRKGEKGTREWVTSFAPKTAELTSDVIKVHGKAKVSSYKKDGRTGAKVETSHIVVYAIQRPGQPGTATRLVRHERGTVLFFRYAGELVISLDDWGASSTPARCDVDDGYIHPQYDDSAPDKVEAKGPPTDPYELDEPESDGECGVSEET
ncbi:hypothetical protein [Nonomuraea insulae]|uniref:Uncharacterized protein n=1 Tax=Nonomuraea insulae TaxID=1616787 RepID=A0ABW1D3D5_9ACTN